MQEALHTFLNETRDARLKKEREAVIKKRFAELDKAIIAHCVTIPRDATMDCHPLALDLALQADLEPIANAPSSERVTSEMFAAIVPKLVTDWEAEQRKFLRSFFRRFITKVPRGGDILDLAIAIFYCSSCSPTAVREMRYPYFLTWSSFRYCNARNRQSSAFNCDHYAAPARPNPYSAPCDLTSFEPKQVEMGIKWMRNIVTKLGLDPGTATFADLEQCEARLRCLKCADLGGQQGAYTWEAAVSALYDLRALGRDADMSSVSQFAHTAEHNTTHSHNAYPRSSHNRWSRVTKADMPKVKEREAVAHALTVESDCLWSCALCVDWKGRGGEGKVRKHLASK